MARSYESLWLWLGAAFVAVGAALLGVAGGLDAASKVPYSFWTSAPVIVAYAMFGLSLVCFACAIREVPIPYPLSRSNAEPASAKASGAGAKASVDSATPSMVSAVAAEDSAKTARDLLRIEQAREYDRMRPKLSGRLVPEPGITGPTNAWLEVYLDASTPQPLRKVLLSVPAGAWFGRGGMPPRPTSMSSDFGFPGEPGQVPPVRPGRPARWRVHRADIAHGAVTATVKCTSEDGTVWEDVEVPISQDYEDAGSSSG